MSEHELRLGEPADRFFKELDKRNKELRVALVAAAEQFLIETLTAAVDANVITADQANTLKDIATGPQE